MRSQVDERIDVDVAASIARLPFIDVHRLATSVEDPELVWRSLGQAIERGWRVPGFATRLLATEPSVRHGDPLLSGSTLPGFHVSHAEAGQELVLQGHHRFSSYALIFRLAPSQHGISMSAETRASFPGLQGRLYRTLVIGTRGHVLVVRGLLHATRRLAQRAA